jgi:hypothetical protein
LSLFAFWKASPDLRCVSVKRHTLKHVLTEKVIQFEVPAADIIGVLVNRKVLTCFVLLDPAAIFSYNEDRPAASWSKMGGKYVRILQVNSTHMRHWEFV